MSLGPFPVSHWGGREEPPEEDEEETAGPSDAVQESVQVSDHGIIEVPGVVEKVAVEVVEVSESVERDATFEVSEAVDVSDDGEVDVLSVVEKVAVERVGVSESVAQDLTSEVKESVSVSDEGIIETLERLEEKVAVEDVNVSEVVEIVKTLLGPVVLNVVAQEDGTTAWVEFDAGDYCESVDVDYQLNNDGVWRNHYTEDTTPNTTGYVSPDVGEASDGDVVEFRLIPYSEDQEGGHSGTAKFSGEVTVGGGGEA